MLRLELFTICGILLPWWYILPKVTVSRRGIIVIVESLIVDIEYTDVMGKAKIIFH